EEGGTVEPARVSALRVATACTGALRPQPSTGRRSIAFGGIRSRARTCARTTCVREGDSAGPATSCESARATWRGGRAEATPAARRGQRAEEEETMNETLKTSEMTAGMMGWRAGLGMARKVSASRRAALVAIVSRLLCAEQELRTWIAET